MMLMHLFNDLCQINFVVHDASLIQVHFGLCLDNKILILSAKRRNENIDEHLTYP